MGTKSSRSDGQEALAGRFCISSPTFKCQDRRSCRKSGIFPRLSCHMSNLLIFMAHIDFFSSFSENSIENVTFCGFKKVAGNYMYSKREVIWFMSLLPQTHQLLEMRFESAACHGQANCIVSSGLELTDATPPPCHHVGGLSRQSGLPDVKVLPPFAKCDTL